MVLFYVAFIGFLVIIYFQKRFCSQIEFDHNGSHIKEVKDLAVLIGFARMVFFVVPVIAPIPIGCHSEISFV
jgi:hypothetical protein